MGRYLTTADDFEIFREAVAYWQKRLGLLDWHIYTRHKSRDPRTQASCYPDLPGRCATIYLSKVLYNYDEPPGETFIRRMAFHEVCELLMARMMICATARYVTRDEMDEARHEIVRTLEHVIFDAEEESRLFTNNPKKSFLD
jgi:hypothetical protein